jgi:hypothetical protein
VLGPLAVYILATAKRAPNSVDFVVAAGLAA